jgi:SHS family lactate transporter-like MFS transporter
MIEAIFGLLSDRFGRKWPLVANLVIVSVLELGAGFAQNFKGFLAARSLFGIGMGGIWGTHLCHPCTGIVSYQLSL